LQASEADLIGADFGARFFSLFFSAETQTSGRTQK